MKPFMDSSYMTSNDLEESFKSNTAPESVSRI